MPVLRLRGQAVLHDHHRAHVVGALEVAHVVALDPQRGLGQPQSLLQFAQGPGPGVVVCCPLQAVPHELLLGVARDGLQQGSPVPSLRYPDRHRSTAFGCQPLGQQRPVIRILGNQHLAGYPLRGILPVVGRQDLGHQPPPVQVLRPVHHEALAPHHPSPSYVEHLGRRLQLVARQADDIEVLMAGGHHLLLLQHPQHAGEPVAQAGRRLELEGLGGVSHLLPESGDHLVGVAVQEPQQIAHDSGVVLGCDLPDARATALLDVEEEARPAHALVLAELRVATGPGREGTQQQVEGLPDGPGVAIGPEVPDPPLPLSPGDHRTRPLVAHRHRQERVGLVVLQVDVEARPVLLDEVELQHQGLKLVGDLDPLHRGRLVEHLGRTVGHPVPPPEVAVQAVPEALGLAHVQDSTLGIAELVRPRCVGHRARHWTFDHRQRVGAVHPWWDRRVVGRHITVDAETAEWTRVALDRMLAIT